MTNGAITCPKITVLINPITTGTAENFWLISTAEINTPETISFTASPTKKWPRIFFALRAPWARKAQTLKSKWGMIAEIQPMLKAKSACAVCKSTSKPDTAISQTTCTIRIWTAMFFSSPIKSRPSIGSLKTGINDNYRVIH